jgi:hypothetical protein
MPQKEKDNKIFQSIKGKLTTCRSKNLSLVAKTLVANQVILVFICYVASCADPSFSAMKKVKSFIRDYV